MQQGQEAASFALLPEAVVAVRPGPLEGSGSERAPAWAYRLEQRHAQLMTVATMLIALLDFFGYVAPSASLVLLVVAVSLLGLPHGALDYLVGKELFAARLGAWWFLPFGAIYLGLLGLVVVCWMVAPSASLVAFFVVSAAHFGLGDVRPELALASETSLSSLGLATEAAARGSLVIVALLFAHPTEVAALLTHLVPHSAGDLEVILRREGPRLAVVNGALLAVVLAHHLGGWAAGSDAHGRTALEIIALTALFCLASPLIAFTVYFCLWHSFRHSVRLAAGLRPAGPGRAFAAFVRRAWPTTAGAIVLGALAYSMGDVGFGETTLISVVFIGLSALTAPHVVFCVAADHRRARAR